MTTPWFNLENLAWIGPTAGVTEALWGGAVGLLAWAFVQKGRGQVLVYGWLYLGLIASLICFAAAALAGMEGQPPMIGYIFLSLGAPLCLASVISLVNVRVSYRQAELRRMKALEQ